jgi:uncharacterized protein (DUF2252 family)
MTEAKNESRGPTGLAHNGEESGRALRKVVPRSLHADWVPKPGRADPVRLLEEQNASRLPWLVPLRHSRMSVSPFTFYRGAARIMASDLAATPSTGLTVQLVGDAHLSNFGAYASPERRLVFDANDFDETLPGPWEWDLKRLATSVMIAGQHLGFSRHDRSHATSTVTQAFRTAMAEFSAMGFVELFYDYTTVEDLRSARKRKADKLYLARFQKKAHRKSSIQATKKLATMVGGRYQIRRQAPVLYPLRDLPAHYESDALEAAARRGFELYKESLSGNRRWLLERYDLVDVGIKVVGVGSVGTRAMVLLLQGRNENDPLMLQAKEADSSVLEEYLAPSPYENHGRRVVEGQRMVQAQSDIFLGWTSVVEPDNRHFYIRQMRDWKGSVVIDGATPRRLANYAALCGRTLARGHARSGDAAAIRAYAGSGESLDRAVTAFAEKYSATNLEDFESFRAAIADGRLEAAETEIG